MQLIPYLIIRREDLRGSPDWIDGMLRKINQALSQLTTCLSGQTEITNNLDSQVVTGTFAHGVAQTVTANKLVNPPAFVIPGLAQGAPIRSANITAIPASGQVTIVVYFEGNPTAAQPVKLFLFGAAR